MVIYGVEVWSFGVRILSMQRIMIRSDGRGLFLVMSFKYSVRRFPYSYEAVKSSDSHSADDPCLVIAQHGIVSVLLSTR